MARPEASAGFGFGDEALVASGVLEDFADLAACFFASAAVFVLRVAVFDATLVEGLRALDASFTLEVAALVATLVATGALGWAVTTAFGATGAALGAS
jgi:hypothetical protein